MRRSLLVVGLVAAILLNGAAFASSAPVACASPPPDLGKYQPAKEGKHIPTTAFIDRDGNEKSLADLRGQGLIVNFWATWCAPCRREIPLLLELQREHGREGFQVIGIAADFRDKVIAYSDEMKIDYPLLIGEQEALDAAAAFGVAAVGFPFTVFSDRKGRIVTAHLGELTAPQAKIILDAVRRVDAGELSPEQARIAVDAAIANLPAAPDSED